MISKTLFIGALSIVVFHYGKLYSQQTILASGNNASGIGGTSSASIGQIAFFSKGLNNEIVEGVQQSYEIFTLSVDNPKAEYNISFYPNPVHDLFFIDFNDQSYVDSKFQIFDFQGRIVMKGKLNDKKTVLSLQSLPISTYIIKIYKGTENVKTFKIVKKQ